jgi:hypothetical protein
MKNYGRRQSKKKLKNKSRKGSGGGKEGKELECD